MEISAISCEVIHVFRITHYLCVIKKRPSAFAETNKQ